MNHALAAYRLRPSSHTLQHVLPHGPDELQVAAGHVWGLKMLEGHMLSSHNIAEMVYQDSGCALLSFALHV